MSSRLITVLFLCSLAGSLAACGVGGSEAGNPSAFRGVEGQLNVSPPSALSQSVIANACLADQVLAIDSAGGETLAFIDIDCSFRLELVVDTAYRILFMAGDTRVAAMQFQNDADLFPAPVMIISPDVDDIMLGDIPFSEGVVFPETEPSQQNDIDADGLSDYVDEDDDDDGVPDIQEPDCDLDGIIDDFDADLEKCEPDHN